MAKVDIISGFLGAGKTTFIKLLLKECLNDEKVVLIENEFGEIGIDGAFMQESSIEIKEMNSGCICCSLVGDFKEALEQVISTYHPDRIIIEPSGVGKLSDVIKAVNDMNNDELVLNQCLCVVDGKKCLMYTKNFGEFFNNQIKYASCILLSRTSNLDEDKLHQAIHAIRHINNDAPIITTPFNELNKDVLLKIINNTLLPIEINEHHCHCGCSHEHHHHADDVFMSIGIETIHTYTKEQLEELFKQFNLNQYGQILRAKGIVKGEDSWLHFDYVPQEYNIRSGQAHYIGQICIIGHDLNEDKLRELFGE